MNFGDTDYETVEALADRMGLPPYAFGRVTVSIILVALSKFLGASVVFRMLGEDLPLGSLVAYQVENFVSAWEATAYDPIIFAADGELFARFDTEDPLPELLAVPDLRARGLNDGELEAIVLNAGRFTTVRDALAEGVALEYATAV